MPMVPEKTNADHPPRAETAVVMNRSTWMRRVFVSASASVLSISPSLFLPSTAFAASYSYRKAEDTVVSLIQDALTTL
jgi:hypothetical protein